MSALLVFAHVAILVCIATWILLLTVDGRRARTARFILTMTVLVLGVFAEALR